MIPKTRANHLTQALKNSKTLYSLTVRTSLIPSTKPKSRPDRLFELVVRSKMTSFSLGEVEDGLSSNQRHLAHYSMDNSEQLRLLPPRFIGGPRLCSGPGRSFPISLSNLCSLSRRIGPHGLKRFSKSIAQVMLQCTQARKELFSEISTERENRLLTYLEAGVPQRSDFDRFLTSLVTSVNFQFVPINPYLSEFVQRKG